MQRSAAKRSLPLNLVIILTAIFAQIIHAAPQVSTTKRQPLTATWQALEPRGSVTFPSYQLNPSTILWPPNCAAEDPNICLGSTTVKGCTVEYCSHKVALTCWTHVYAIDFDCLCKSMSSMTCPSCTSGVSGINNQLYLAWLSKYCPLDAGWNGLPANWEASVPDYNILQLSSQSGTSNSISYVTDNPFTSQFITDQHNYNENLTPPNCAIGCTWLYTRWNASLVDGDVVTGLAGAKVFQANYTIGGPPQSGQVYLDLTAFCVGWTWSDFQGNCTGDCNDNLSKTGLLWWLNESCGNITGFTGLPTNWQNSLFVTNSTFLAQSNFPSCLGVGNSSDCPLIATESSCSTTLCSSIDRNGNCQSTSAVGLECFCPQAKYGNCTGVCSSNTDNTGLLWFLNQTCGNYTGFNGLPSDWRDDLYITNSTYPPSSSFPSLPSCLTVGNYPDCQLNATETKCTSARCSSIGNNGACTSVPTIGLECFCSQVKYGISCTENCLLSRQRPSYLNWLNDACSALGPGTSLPTNWTSLLSVQRSEMIPWSWQLAFNTSLSAGSQPHCPSASGKLGAFAAVNIFMLLLIPIVTRRTVIKKLTFGYFGRQESRYWYFTGLVAVGLHLASNAANAAIIKGTPGYGNTSIKDLTFFWCTRPRLAWLVVALLPYEAEKSMYFSATASILFGEVILQLFAAYNMVIATNYARRQKFLLKGHLVGSWYAKQAMIMYAGAILWLTAVPFAVAACMWSVLGVSERIGRLSEYLTETRKLMKDNCATVSAQVKLLQAAKSKMVPRGQVSWQQQAQSLQNRLATDIEGALEEWDKLTETWTRMPHDLHREQKTRQTVKKRAERAKDRLESARQSARQRRFDENEAAEQKESENDRAWLRTPAKRENDALGHQGEIEERIVIYPARKAEIQGLVAACKQRMLPFENAIAQAQARIAEDDADLKNIRREQMRVKSKWKWRWRWTFVDMEKFLDLKDEYDAIAHQRQQDLTQLKAAQNNVQLKLETVLAADLQGVLDAWEALSESKKSLKKNWEENEKQWRLIGEKRREEKKKPNVGRFPLVVVVGMLLCWIAQWLWWAGYVGVAGDKYCPPKLPLLASIWTIFSGTGSMFGASF